MRVDYLGLEAFVAIADHGSFHRAADSLSLSQAALSHRLRKIEQDLGAALLIRTSREVSLTAIGQGLLPEARALLKALQDTYESVRTGAQRKARRLAFACLPSIANVLLGGVLDRMAARRPEISFEVLDIPVAQISEAVRSGEAEFGVTIMSAELADLRLRPLVDEEYHLFVRHDHPLAGKPHVGLPDLIGPRLARIRSQSKNRQLLDAAFGDLRDHLHWHFEVQNATMAMRLVNAGVALTILPRSAIGMAPASLVALPFHGVRLQRTLGIVSRRAVPISGQASELLGLIKAEMLERFSAHVDVSSDRASRPRD
ncbi:MAG: LysR family transcriptional regulator [Paracoccus sp. (in: a-proteobacteria)]|uniref:LysR family transcriptional regulator n=1 Tax=Paracoccus sp. TaxID=267 RepID=UPI004058DBBE|tara:strand:+ start:10921 stop:11862 length:942 start_codon:yes stop_codon:yes gene_type:complete